jgi:hypothetical protein
MAKGTLLDGILDVPQRCRLDLAPRIAALEAIVAPFQAMGDLGRQIHEDAQYDESEHERTPRQQRPLYGPFPGTRVAL